MNRQLSLLESLLPDEVTGADFSPCRTWRYSLWRMWDYQSDANCLMFIGLNPSTADETKNDPTIRRCIGFAKRWGFGGLFMMNAYAFRATNPRDMKAATDPVGPGNDEALRRIGERVGAIIAAWGVHCEPSREAHVCQLIGRPIECLGITKDGRPKHPLYLPSDAERRVFWSPPPYEENVLERYIRRRNLKRN